VIRSIRLRVALGVFGVVVTLVALQNVYALDRFERSFREDLDDELREELAEARDHLGMPDLQSWIDDAVRLHSRAGELFVEVRGPDGRIAASSANVPKAGFPGAQPLESSRAERIFEVVHPRSRSGARHIRGIEARIGPWEIRIAFGIEQIQRWVWTLRRNLLTSLMLISVLGAFSAWWVSRRALQPLSEMAARAASLGALPEGSLPRTGSGDEIDRLARVLNDLLARTRAEALRVRRLTADVAHALRTPLTAIRGNLELHVARARGSEAEAVGATIEQVDELGRLVKQLLLLERLENSPDDNVKRERVELYALARSLVEFMRAVGEERGVKLELAGEPVEVDADPVQIRQAIVNLLDNSLRHTPGGGRVEIEVGARGGRARVAVFDSGPGLPPGSQERVFERFYSTTAANGEGTGLGLAIARAIVRAHGGDVTASSPGGALFVIDLPLVAAAPA
jgi:signal transduction histidine kinase